MRVSPLRAQLVAAGAQFEDRYGVEVPLRVADLKTEYSAVRNAVGLTDFSWMRVFRLPEDKGLDLLDALVAGNVPKIRFGRALHTLLADPEGYLTADCYVVNNDQEFLLFAESIVPDSVFDSMLAKAGDVSVAEDLSHSHTVVSLDGLKAWEIVKLLFGSDVLGLPYLAIENYTFENTPVRLIRAGKTSEFGYLLLIPNSIAPALWNRLESETRQRGGTVCGVAIHNELRLEGRFFNIHAEGRRVRDPLALGLQWMIDFSKEQFSGSTALHARRTAGLKQKLVGMAGGADCEQLRTDASIVHQGASVGRVVAQCFSHVMDARLGLAVLPVDLAFSGLTFELEQTGGPRVRTISMPPIMPKSLTVKLDEL